MTKRTSKDTRPPPMTPPDCDLRSFPFMPLHVQRLRDSDLVSAHTLEELGANALLWSVSWHQVPAASLPNNDKSLMHFIGVSHLAHFRRIRPGALHGWVLCSDDRLYHPVVATEALTAWATKLRHRWMSECARIRKHNQRHGTRFPSPTYEEFEAAGFTPYPLPVTSVSRVTGAGPGIPTDTDTDTDTDTVEEGYPSQSSAQVIGIGGTRA